MVWRPWNRQHEVESREGVFSRIMAKLSSGRSPGVVAESFFLDFDQAIRQYV